MTNTPTHIERLKAMSTADLQKIIRYLRFSSLFCILLCVVGVVYVLGWILTDWHLFHIIDTPYLPIMLVLMFSGSCYMMARNDSSRAIEYALLIELQNDLHNKILHTEGDYAMHNQAPKDTV